MEVVFRRAAPADAGVFLEMQREAFAGLLEKYRDYETDPACETLERLLLKLEQPHRYYYFIEWNGATAGAICVVDFHDPAQRKRISPLFILPGYRGRGLAQAAIREAERRHGAAFWMLSTIAQEAGNCHLYEKMGYHLNGWQSRVNDRMTLVGYEKD